MDGARGGGGPDRDSNGRKAPSATDDDDPLAGEKVIQYSSSTVAVST